MNTLQPVFDVLRLDLEKPQDRAKAKSIQQSVRKRSLTLVDAALPQRTLVEIKHLGAKAVVMLNQRHLFTAQILGPMKAMAALESGDLDRRDASVLLKKVCTGMELLLLAYAKAQSMHSSPDEAFRGLRRNWGHVSHALIGSKRGD